MAHDNDQSIPPEARYIVSGVDPYGRKFRGLYDYETARYLGKDCLNTIIDRVTMRVVNCDHLKYKPR